MTLLDRAAVTAERSHGAPLSNTSNDVTVLADQTPTLALVLLVTAAFGFGVIAMLVYLLADSGAERREPSPVAPSARM